MKADTTRSTFKQARHYSGVRMQQGRVQLDADWNEQIDITGHRVETESIDVIGHCGAPMHFPGFHVVKNFDGLSVEEKTLPENQNPPVIPAGDLLISGGRYYVDGILCEIEKIVRYTQQPDLPDTPAVAASGTFLAYIDVWSRNITALEDPALREVALGGPDTATRSKTVWQVKLVGVDSDATCSTAFPSGIGPGTGKLAARAEPGAPSSDPCIVSPGAGYRRLENQHYRVEVHDTGVRGKATFKWSRDNGAIVTKWESQDPGNLQVLTVGSIGRDKVLRFAAGQWIELLDDTCELLEKPGTLVQIDSVLGDVLTIKATTVVPPIANFPRNPKIRRWDMAALLKPTDQSWLNLEDGVQVQFSGGLYKTGDYWLIPARTATADVEWPIDPSTNLPATELPSGILHHYCRLAVLKNDGATWTSITDCREIFPPLTGLISFSFAGGDGQEAMPDLTKPDLFLPLARPLEAGVTHDRWPVAGATIRFTLESGSGQLQGGTSPQTVLTDATGIARCAWSLDSTTLSQQVKAVLLDDFGKPICTPIHYNANLSVASQVAYDPAECPGMMADNVINVQDAIDHLCKRHQGCCDVTVGNGGQFERLDEAINKLINIEKKADICICLLPGDHILPQGVVISNPSNTTNITKVKIAGCGLATRILVGNPEFPSKSSMEVGPLASFTLRDVAISTKSSERLIQCDGVDEVRIENCHLSATSRAVLGAPSLVTIQRAKFVSVSDSYLSSYSLVEQVIFNQLNVEPPVLFSTKPLSSTIDELAAALGKATQAVRHEFVKPYQESLQSDEDISNKMRASMQEAIATILENGHESKDGQARYGLAVGYLVYGRTLVLMDAMADTLVENNRFAGPIMLYGNGVAFSAVDWRTFAKKIIDRTVTLTEPKATLQIRNNSLTGISVDRSVGTQQPTPFIPNLYGGCLLAENWCYSAVYQVLANHVNTTANQFNYNLDLVRDVGTVAGRSAIIVGNSAPNAQSTLYYAVPTIALPGGPTPAPPIQVSANLLTIGPVTSSNP